MADCYLLALSWIDTGNSVCLDFLSRYVNIPEKIIIGTQNYVYAYVKGWEFLTTLPWSPSIYYLSFINISFRVGFPFLLSRRRANFYPPLYTTMIRQQLSVESTTALGSLHPYNWNANTTLHTNTVEALEVERRFSRWSPDSLRRSSRWPPSWVPPIFWWLGYPRRPPCMVQHSTS